MEHNKYTSSDFKVDMSNLEFAPIVVFAYIRPKKLEKLIISLKKNAEFKNSKVIFYVDKYKDESEKKKNLEVISVIKNYCNNLNYEINNNKKNLGLKNNILNGINKSLKKYNRAIFLEDDLLVSNNFLKYMNEALNMYSDKKEVMGELVKNSFKKISKTKKSKGKVFLVGAGPGDPELITAKGLRVIQNADIILHDALIHPHLVFEINPLAKKIFVGKRSNCF